MQWHERAEVGALGELRSALGSNICPDVAGASTTSGANVQIFQCNGTVAQQWFEKSKLANTREDDYSVTINDVRLNRGSNMFVDATAGQSISIAVDYKIVQPGWCPSCIDQILAATDRVAAFSPADPFHRKPLTKPLASHARGIFMLHQAPCIPCTAIFTRHQPPYIACQGHLHASPSPLHRVPGASSRVTNPLALRARPSSRLTKGFALPASTTFGCHLTCATAAGAHSQTILLPRPYVPITSRLRTREDQPP